MTEKYYAKLKTNNILEDAYLNKKLTTDEFLLSTKNGTKSYQTLFTIDELDDILGQDLSSYELIPYGVSHSSDNKYRFDGDGYDREGYDIDGFDRSGYDRDGFDEYGFDRDGFDAYGYENLNN